MNNTNENNSQNIFLQEENMILDRKDNGDPNTSATAKAFSDGPDRITQKFLEEAAEVGIAILSQKQGPKEIISETADLLYRLQIALVLKQVSWMDIEAEIVRRR